MGGGTILRAQKKHAAFDCLAGVFSPFPLPLSSAPAQSELAFRSLESPRTPTAIHSFARKETRRSDHRNGVPLKLRIVTSSARRASNFACHSCSISN